ncbi:hypothetical protein [Pseudoxanthomonas mexicana]
MSRSFPYPLRIALAGLLIVAGSSTWGGEPIHKCRATDGRAIYQATPCAASDRTEWVRDYPPDPPSIVVVARSSEAPSTDASPTPPRTRPTRRSGPAQGAVISMHRDPDACERAKKARERAYARRGLKRDFATSRRFDDRVNEACR